MDLPVSLVGWANLIAHSWAILAYLLAAFAGVRALRLAYDNASPVFPLCLVTDATRWLFGVRMSSQEWRPRDFISLGVFGAVLGCLFGALMEMDFLSGFDWRKLGYGQGLRQGFAGAVTGSALIILHCGVALRFKKGGA